MRRGFPRNLGWIGLVPLLAGCLDVEPQGPPVDWTIPEGLSTTWEVDLALEGHGVQRATVPVWTGRELLPIEGELTYAIPRGHTGSEFVIVQLSTLSPIPLGYALGGAIGLPAGLAVGLAVNGQDILAPTSIAEDPDDQDYVNTTAIRNLVLPDSEGSSLRLDVAYEATPGSANPPWVKLKLTAPRPAFGPAQVATETNEAFLVSYRDGDLEGSPHVKAIVTSTTASVAVEATHTLNARLNALLLGIGYVVSVNPSAPLGTINLTATSPTQSATYGAGLGEGDTQFDFGLLAPADEAWEFKLKLIGVGDYLLLYVDLPDGLLPLAQVGS